jgi:hypothetical protein
LLAAVLVLGAAACGSSEDDAGESQDPSAEGSGALSKVYASRRDVPIVADADADASQLGTLALGGSVLARGEPRVTEDCPGGWQGVEPAGFVCLGEGASLEPPPHHAVMPRPPVSAPLPHRYARVRRGGTVAYATAPGLLAQRLHEPRLEKRRRHPRKERRLGAAANDVPLDDAGLPTGPPVVRPDAVGVAEDGYRYTTSFFALDQRRPTVPVGLRLTPPPPNPPIVGALADHLPAVKVLRRRSVVALAGDVKVEIDGEPRDMHVLPDGSFIPSERLEPVLGTTWHGLPLKGLELPVAFALRSNVHPRYVEGRRAVVQDEVYALRQAIPLTGRYRTIDGERHYATRDERWVRHRDIIMIFNRHEFPDFAAPGQRWIDVSLANQTLVAYEGKKALYATLISSGRERLGDPETEAATPQGVFRVASKRVTRDVPPDEVSRRYQVLDAPWVIELDSGIAVAGGVWLSAFGDARGHHDIAVAPIDAHWLFRWATPSLPAGWHSVDVGENAEATIVYVHK